MSAVIRVDDEILHSSVESVLFDKDGTLIDIHHYWVSMIKIRTEQISTRWQVTNGSIKKYQDTLLDAMGIDLETEKMKPDGPVGIKPRAHIVKVAADVVRSQNYRITDNDMESLFKSVDEQTSKNMSPLLSLLPGVKTLLQDLTSCGVKLAVVSTDLTSRAKRAIEVLSIEHYFSEIVGGDDVENSKPAPDMANLVLKKLGVDASKSVVIGDHPVDINMGLQSGITTNIGVLNGISNSDAFNGQKCYLIENLDKIIVDCTDDCN